MFVLKNFLFAVGHILNMIISLYIWVIILDVIFSWVGASPYNTIVKAIRNISFLLLGNIRKRINLTVGMLDLTPLISILFLQFIKIFVVASLLDFARTI